MSSINLISRHFHDSITSTKRAAIAFHLAVLEGANALESLAALKPDARVEVAEDPSNSAAMTVYWNYTNKQLLEYLNKNRHQIVEVFHSRVLQQWFDYLGEIYFFMAVDVLKGKNQWPLPKVNASVDLKEFLPRDLEHNLANCVYQSFMFLPAEEKRRTVFKALKSDASLSKRLDKISDKIQTIEINNTIRNILQHKAGRVTADDLKRHGVGSFETKISDKKVIKVKANQIIFRTDKTSKTFAARCWRPRRRLDKFTFVPNIPIWQPRLKNGN